MELFNTLFVSGIGDTEMWGAFILRLGFGIALMVHGYPKLFKNFGQFSGYVTSLKWPVPKLFALLAGITELFGGLLLIVGVLTKPVSLVVAFYFVLVMLSAHRGQKFVGGWELPFLYFVAALALWALNDPGVFALWTF